MESSLSEALETAVKGDKWREVDSLLARSNYSTSVVDQFVTACEQYDKICADQELLSHCTTQQLDRLLTLATTPLSKATRGDWWSMVHTVLQIGGSFEKRLWVIKRACDVADFKVIEEYILPHVNDDFLSQCSTEQLDSILSSATVWCLWGMVYKVFMTGRSQKKLEWVIERAPGTWACKFCVLYLFGADVRQCNIEQLDTLLTTATTRGWCHLVHEVFKDVDSHEKRVWVIEQLCETAKGWHFEEYILPHIDDDFLSHCSEEQLDRLLTVATTNGRWQVVHTLLQAGGSLEKRLWVIEQACKTATNFHFEKYIISQIDDDLSHSSAERLDHLLTKATKAGLWPMVHKLLKAVDSPEKRVWAIQQASKTARDRDFEKYILPHIDDDLMSHCSAEQGNHLLTKATQAGLWPMVHTVLKADVDSPEKRAWVIEQACKTADLLDFQRYISPHCDNHQLYNHIVRGVNPLTNRVGHQLLSYAVLNWRCPQRMVGECIRLGFSAHQPPPIKATKTDIGHALYRMHRIVPDGIITSPFLLAVLHGMPVVAHMLYESGSCSYSELLHVYTMLLDLSDPDTVDGRKFLEGSHLIGQNRRVYFDNYRQNYEKLRNTLTIFLPYLKEMASSPRSLMSSCRLVISHCLTVRCRRERTVQDLPVSNRMKDYLLFSDLTDPDYQRFVYGTLPPLASQK